nr:2,5-diamino-6-(ribosylamino)-4(3H)-pyrimidinone 5'-phosphate reductase [Candidatus Sigynarchaeum springense]
MLLNAAMSIDGKICTRSGDSKFSDEEDWRQVHAIRASVDAIMVGINTVIQDNPSLRIKYWPARSPLVRVVVDSACRIPVNARVLDIDPQLAPTIVCVTERASIERQRAIEALGADVIAVNEGARVDVKKMITCLYQRNIRTVLLEGGGTLNWSMVEARLVDEIRLCIAPVLVGGQGAKSLVEGTGFNLVEDSLSFHLHSVEPRGDRIIVRYKRQDARSLGLER